MPEKNFYEKNYGCSLEKILSYRNFKSYELASETNKNQVIFNKIQSDIRKMVQNNDSENGIHIKFNTKTKYCDVVRILDICEIEKVQTYILKDYDVWIMTGRNSELEKNYPMKRITN